MAGLARHRRRPDSRHAAELQDFAKRNKGRADFTDILLLGMGGSSLCPEVLRRPSAQHPGFPRLHVLDSTDPAQVKAIESRVDLAKTLFIVSSKSGSTLEPNIFKQYFFERMQQTVGADKAGSHFIAVTDPGSKMQQVAEPTVSATFSTACPPSAGAIPRCRISAWCRPPPWASTSADFSNAPTAMVDPAAPRVPVEQESRRACWASSWVRLPTRPRQGHAHHFARDLRFRRMARTADRGIHRQSRARA